MGKPQISAIGKVNRVQPVRYLNDWLHSFSDSCCKEYSIAEHIEHARKLNRQASDDIDHGRLETGNLEEAHTNLSIVIANLENVDVANLQTAPVGAPLGVPAVWCEIVD